MRPFANILVDIDADAAAHPELETAARVARQCGARLRVIDAAASAGARLGMGVPRRVARFGYGGETTIESPDLAGSPEEALVREVERSGHDLVVRSQARDLVGRSAGINLHLFRHCPCPVWAVGAGGVREQPRIVAAVDASDADPVTQALNVQAVEMALLLAGLEDGSVIVLQAWRPFAEKKLSVRATEAEFDWSLQETHRRAADDLARLVNSFGPRFAGARIELRKGFAEDVIPEFVVAEGIDIVVTGTRGETGLWHRLFGSTAQRLLESAPCSVIAVKLETRAATSSPARTP
jgi:nucleotide-binding universal stress UspA family protein